MIRFRVKFSIKGGASFISHLDLLRTFERSLRRANLPIAFSQGFNPHPRILFGSVLPVGVESEEEYVDFILNEQYNSKQFKQKLNLALPSEISVLAVKQITKDMPSLMEKINLAAYSLQLCFKSHKRRSEISNWINDFLLNEEIIVVRKTKKGEKKIDLKPLIRKLELVEKDEKQGEEKNWELLLVAQTGSKGNLRTDHLVTELNRYLPDLDYVKVRRTGLFIEDEGEIFYPLSQDQPVPVKECNSINI